jgi:hypothetical protein
MSPRSAQAVIVMAAANIVSPCIQFGLVLMADYRWIGDCEGRTNRGNMGDVTDAPPKVRQLRRLGMFGAVVFAAFLLGFLPMWLSARARTIERNAVQQALRLAELENALAAAALQARRGDYEPAREAASIFFTNLQAQLDGSPTAFSAPQREMMQSILAQRDQVITLLARADPAVAERLSDAYVTYRREMGNAGTTRGQ